MPAPKKPTLKPKAPVVTKAPTTKKPKTDIYGRVITPDMEAAANAAESRTRAKTKAELAKKAGKGGIQQSTGHRVDEAARRAGYAR